MKRKSGNAVLTGGITGANATTPSPVAGAASITSGAITNPITAPGQLTGTVTVDGVGYSFNFTTTTTTTTAEIVAALGAATASNGSSIGGVATIAGTPPVFTTLSKGASSTISLQITSDGGTGLATLAADQGSAAGPQIVTTTGTFGAFKLDSNDMIKFDVTVDGNAKSVKVDKATITKALGTTDGKVTSVGDYAKVLNLALKNANVSGVTASATTVVVFTGAADIETLSVGAALANDGESILDIDVTTADKAKLASYLENISTAADLVTSGAALLGAVSSRVELQQSFVASLVDTIDKGVSNLIDADLSEESTKLQALQTKQQLGIQALSIANSSTQNILSLFRS